jgi:hypothetical protein
MVERRRGDDRLALGFGLQPPPTALPTRMLMPLAAPPVTKHSAAPIQPADDGAADSSNQRRRIRGHLDLAEHTGRSARRRPLATATFKNRLAAVGGE